MTDKCPLYHDEPDAVCPEFWMLPGSAESVCHACGHQEGCHGDERHPNVEVKTRG